MELMDTLTEAVMVAVAARPAAGTGVAGS